MSVNVLPKEPGWYFATLTHIVYRDDVKRRPVEVWRGEEDGQLKCSEFLTHAITDWSEKLVDTGPATPKCQKCGSELDFDPGSPGAREEPPIAATWYCAKCKIDVC